MLYDMMLRHVRPDEGQDLVTVMSTQMFFNMFRRKKELQATSSVLPLISH